MAFFFIQMSDPQLGLFASISKQNDPTSTLEGFEYETVRYEKAITAANRLNPAFVVITGDLVHHGQPQAYRDLKACLSRLRMPCHLLVGNHDHRGRLLDEFPDLSVDKNGFLQTVIETGAGLFFLLDTIEQGKAWGAYCEKRLAWLQNTLDAAGERPIYLFMHHPPFSVGLPCVDRLGLGTDGERLAEVVAPYANIRHLFFGHVHRPITGSWRGIPYSTMRGTNQRSSMRASFAMSA